MTRRARPLEALRAASLAAAMALSAPASADPYRLRADVYTLASAPSTAGLFTLSGQVKPTSWADAEAAVWMGAGESMGDHAGDVLVANIRLREPHGYGELRIGRMLVTAGAVRPLQLDGAQALGRVPRGPTLQVFGGVPVEPAFGAKAYDWAAGGRLAQRIGEIGSAGVSYLQRRDQGSVAFEELGFDAAVSPVKWLDAAGDVAVDLLHSSVTDARASVALRFGPARFELFGTRRSPAHLLPATSLFAAIGDIPSDQAGLSLSVRAFPRLDVWTSASVDSVGGELGGRQSLRATLRLDDRGDRAVGFELRRQWAPDDAGWTGGRAMLRLPLAARLRASAELEVVFPDVPAGRGDAWPWGIVSVGYSPAPAPWLDFAGAVEAGSTPSKIASVAGLLRASASWGK